MITRLMTVFGILVWGFAAQAQSANCVKSMSLSASSSAVNKFSDGSGKCINDDSVSASFSSFSGLPDASGAHSVLNQKCQAIYGGCAPRVPTYSYGFTAQYVSAETSGNLVSVKFSSTVDDYRCRKVTTNHLAVLDKNIPENALFFSRYPVANLRWMNIGLKCQKVVVSQTTYDASGIPTYNKSYLDCRVSSSSLTSAPYSSCYQQNAL